MSFKEELRDLINRHRRENKSNTPDYILADHLNRCLENFEKTIEDRLKWHKPDK